MTSRSGPSSTSAESAVAAAYRSEWGRLLSLLLARTRRIDLVEDALAEAFTRAAERWAADGVPSNPAGWLYTTAYRLIIGRLRAEAVAGRQARLVAVRPDAAIEPPADDGVGDERLQLILLCCHPALSPDARAALALRMVIGTSTDDIAALFLVSRETMAARVTRAKQKIVSAGIPLARPVDAELADRLDAVCRTLYLAFTAGYTPRTGPMLLRPDLAAEAVELTALLHRLVPEAAEVRALLSLMLLQHSRRDARQIGGELVTLAAQDRTRWKSDEIRAGIDLIDGLSPMGGFGEELRLQALIARHHAVAAGSDATEWGQIADIYLALERLTGSPVVRLNRAVAVAEHEGPEAGLALLVGLDHLLAQSHRLPAVRAELNRRRGDLDAARSAYVEAIERCENEAERGHLMARLAEIRTDASPPGQVGSGDATDRSPVSSSRPSDKRRT